MNLRNFFRMALPAVMLSVMLMGSRLANAATTTVTESFTSTTYKASNTTAVWDTTTGQVSLPTTSVSSYRQTNMSIARDASGNMIMVWIDSRNGAIDVYGAKYNASGTKLWGDTKLNQSVLLDGAWDQYPRVACDSSNNIYVSYAVSSSNLRLLKFDTNGTFLWDQQADSAAYSAEWCLHDLAVDSSNNIYVIYQRYGPQGTGSFLSKFDTSGTKLWGDKYSGMGNDPSIASNAGYTYVASKSGSIARIDASGNQVWTAPLGSLSQVRLAVDASGNVCAVYNTNFNVFYVKYNTGGSLAAGPTQISNTGEMYLGKDLADIATDSSNNKYITFRDRYNTGSGYDYTLRGQKLNASDAAQWTPGGVMFCRDDFADQSGAEVVTDGSGGLFAIWMDSRVSSTSNLYANKILSSGTRAWSTDLALYPSGTSYVNGCFAQTTAIDIATTNVTAATLTYNATLNGQTVNFRMSSNGGTNWYNVTPGTKFTFPIAGSDLRFQAFLVTTNPAVTPYLNDVTVSYDHSDSGSTGTFPYRMYWDTSWLNGLTGWMGSSNGASLTCDPAFTGEKYSGNTSTKFTYNPAAETWAGIYSLYSGSWTGAGINLTGNKRLTFMAKSSVNGVVVTFGTGQDTDSAKKETAVTLSTTWKTITIDLAGLNLSSINGLWYFAIDAASNASIPSPITFYVDEVSYDELSPTTDTTAPIGTPSVPTDAGTTSTSTTVAFNWTIGTAADPESSITGYSLQVSTSTAFSTFIFNGDVGNVLTKSITGCTNGQTYYARVRAKNNVGLYSSYSSASDGILIQLPDTTAPIGTPSTPTDQGTTSTSSSLIFNWTQGTAADAESGIAGYYLQVASDTGFANLIHNADIGNVLTYTLTGGINGSTYYARVRAKNGVGLYSNFSGASDGITIQLESGKVPYALYSEISWNKSLSGFFGSNNGTSLTLDSNFSGEKYKGYTSTKITYDKTKESYAGSYCLDSGSWSGAGVNLSGNTNLTFMVKASTDGVKVKFGLGADSSADTAKKDVAVTLTTSWQKISIDLSGLNLSSINGLWYFSIAESDNSAISNPITFYVDEVAYEGTTSHQSPDAVTDLQATPGPTPGGIQLNWTVPASGSSAYIVKYATFSIYDQLSFDQASTYSQTWTPVASGSSESQVLNGMTPGNYYYIAIKTIDGDDCTSNLSNIVTVIARPVGIGVRMDNTSVQLGEVLAGTTVVAPTAIVITNTGGVPVTMGLSVQSPAGWTASTVESGFDTFVLNAAFASAADQITWNNACHALTTTNELSTVSQFAGDQTGVNIPLDGIRKLWLQFLAPPRISIGISTQTIYINIVVEAAN